MQDFLPIDLYFDTNPKTLNLERLAGPSAPGCLVMLWLWAAKNRRDGNLSGLDETQIASISKWQGDASRFVTALRDSGFLDGDELHDWSNWQKFFVAASHRRQSAIRASRYRSRKKVRDAVTLASRIERDASQEERRGEEIEKREDQKHTPRALVLLEKLDLQNGTNGKHRSPAKPPKAWTPPSDLPWFREFWTTHPFPVSGRECEEIWRRRNLESIGATIVAALRDQLGWDQYQGENLQFLKRTPSYLRKSRWEDLPPRPIVGMTVEAVHRYDAKGNRDPKGGFDLYGNPLQ